MVVLYKPTINVIALKVLEWWDVFSIAELALVHLAIHVAFSISCLFFQNLGGKRRSTSSGCMPLCSVAKA